MAGGTPKVRASRPSNTLLHPSPKLSFKDKPASGRRPAAMLRRKVLAARALAAYSGNASII